MCFGKTFDAVGAFGLDLLNPAQHTVYCFLQLGIFQSIDFVAWNIRPLPSFSTIFGNQAVQEL